VRADRHQVDLILLDVDGDFAEGLDRVTVEQDAFLAADRADLPDWLDDADFVVGGHYTDQNGLGLDRVAKAVEIEQAVGPRRENGGSEAAHRVEDGAVLRRHRDNVVAFGAVGFERALDGKVVGFGGAAGEDNLARGRAC
jgi:hypothetical protein